MGSIKAEKFQTKKKSRKRIKTQFLLHNILVHLVAGLACSLFFSNPFRLCSSMKHFFLTSLPCIWSSSFNPKCLFVVVNVIVIFLVGESRLVGENSSSPPARDIYDEYVERSRSLREVKVSRAQEKIRQPMEKRVEEMEDEAEVKETMEMAEDYKEVNSNDEIETLAAAEEEEVEEEEEEEEEEAKQEDKLAETSAEIVEEKEKEIVEEEVGILPAEELNKRVEEFIARVNRQRWMESQLLVCCKA